MKDSFKELSPEELAAKREELKKQYRDLRSNKILGHIDNPLLERTLRRKLTRVTTIIHEYDLGIRKR